MEKKTTLFQRNFTLVVLGQIISLFGNSILRFALPLYLLRQTGSAALFGIVTACSFLPMIVLSLLGGVLADRVNKRNIMVILDFSTAFLIFVFSVAFGKLPLVPLFITILMMLYGIQGAYQPAVQASIPLLVPVDQLMPANAVINQVNALANLLGPIIGGILFSSLGLSPILLISCLCFTLSAIMEIFIRIPHQREKSGARILTIVREDLTDSLRFIREKKPVLFRVMCLLVLFNLFLSAMLIIGLPVLITKTLGMSDRLFGYSQGALAAGGLAGGILAGVLGNKLDVKKSHFLLLVCAGGVLPMGLTLLFHMPPFISYLIITVMSFLLMVASTMFSVQMLVFVQAQTPTELVGKVISCLLALSMCAQPIGQALYGVLFEHFSTVPWIIVLGASLISCVIALYSKSTFNKLSN
ncbi:MFS transporter [Clostridium sp. MB40-C1]|uniref:MFS transporter n=1 Tax=Clostridium sp. MB40-C1 TaxID=3070996 RepID=UPI0027DEC775|nr:MFS transporter [Clostridium sp. MB40-C1]WMJ79489.1 MFS transporter [Clostridium sp. MB40-C1]